MYVKEFQNKRLNAFLMYELAGVHTYKILPELFERAYLKTLNKHSKIYSFVDMSFSDSRKSLISIVVMETTAAVGR